MGVRICSLCLAAGGGFAATSPAWPGDPVPFTEEAVPRGVSYFTPNAPGAGRGVALVDLDGDRDADLVTLGHADGHVGLYENDGNGWFTDRSGASGIAALPGAAGVIAADFDDDGDLDLHIACWESANVLLANDGSFGFTDVTSAAGLPGDAGKTAGCAFADFDLDGWVDLYVGNISNGPNPSPNQLFRNLGDGTFEDVAPGLGVDFMSLTWQAVLFDYDLDGDGDLYISNDKGQAACDWNNYLLRNDGGVFVDVTGESGTGVCIDSMGVALGDFDGNGWPDIYCTNTPFGNPLLLSHGDATFCEESDNAGVGSYETGWAAIFFDYDNDGVLDLYVCNQAAPNRLYENDGVWPCPDMATTLGLDTASDSYCSAVADIDDDGDLDLVVQSNGDRVRLFVNHEGERRHWMKLRVEGRGHDRFGIGARVALTAGGVLRQREVLSGTNFKSQNDLVLHFGLGDATFATQLAVTWPGGPTRSLVNIPADATWTLHPPESLGDADGDGDRDAEDFAALAACYGGPVSPGCEIMDFDGDFAIDARDAGAFVSLYDGPLLDCNDNGVVDLLDILEGSAVDTNGNAIPDACEAGGDVNGDGSVNVLDLLAVLQAWGPCGEPPVGCAGDTDFDGLVNVSDLLAVLMGWSG